MKVLIQFIRATLTGGILFLLPVVLLIMMLNNAHLMLAKVVTPLSDRMPDLILGLDGSIARLSPPGIALLAGC